MPVLAEQAAEQRHEGDANEGDTAASHQLLHTLGLCARIVVAVTFQKVDNAPNAKTGTKSNNEGLEDTNCRSKKCHIQMLLKAKSVHRHKCRTDHRILLSALLSKIFVWFNF